MKMYGLTFLGIMALAFTLSLPPILFAGEAPPHEQRRRRIAVTPPAAAQVVVDPVCGMNIKPEEAAGYVEYQGKTYYFCMASEVETFEKDPETYVAQVEGLQPSGQDHMKGHDQGEAHHPETTEKGEEGRHSMGGHEHHGMHGHWMAPEAEAKRKNPVAATLESMKRGREIFATHCAVCHGSGGKADGFLAATLDPKPADLTGKMSRMHPDGDLFWKISKGKGAMPGWAEAFTEEERWHLVNYIRSLQK